MHRPAPSKTHGARQLFTMIFVGVVLALGLSTPFTLAHAYGIQNPPRCGDGSAPDYGLTYDLLQPHWTVGWERYASEDSVIYVDWILDELNEDSIAQTMILIKPQDEVGIATNCAVHFLRFMQLGLPSGERRDNGFVFLIVVEPESIDVHYAVGLGLPALTARELTNINRAVEEAYESTHSMDDALLTLVREFDTVARQNYEPLFQPGSTPDDVAVPSGSIGFAALCGQLCMGIFVFLILFWIISQMGGSSMPFNPYDPYDDTRTWRGGSYRGFPSGSSRSSSPRMRGGSGSGRSGRTN